MLPRRSLITILVPFLSLGFTLLVVLTYQNLFVKVSSVTVKYGHVLPLSPQLLELKVEKDIYNNAYFVGDVMLGRHVEYLMEKSGAMYPYSKINLNQKNNYLFGNFEASIPVVHKPTLNSNLIFSVDEQYIPGLKMAGFTHLSLANNHTYDFEFEGFQNTKSVLTDSGLATFGHPTTLSSSSVTFIELSEKKVAVISVHALYKIPDKEEISEAFDYANANSDFQVVYIHWGEEYVKKAVGTQRKLAKGLVTAGADLILGHHPHVTQDIQVVDGAVIIYSLGNFIFDQYFSTDVRDGLMVRLNLENQPFLELLPVTSRYSHAQPRLMSDKEKEVFLANLATKSNTFLSKSIRNGRILLPNRLASSTKIVIMAE
jgi:poly-gamma-glutamate synthesis protein (capsule biosynthesis protein)